jgi:hypothetical protein
MFRVEPFQYFRDLYLTPTPVIAVCQRAQYHSLIVAILSGSATIVLRRKKFKKLESSL